MRALILADINELHWYHGSGHADLILAVGDTADSLILEAADAHGASRIFAVKGNHDATTTFARTSPTCIGHESNSAV
jgi:predicted phosphodiesterase